MTCADPFTPEDRRRRLQAWSRYEETPRQLVIELNADGSDYAALGDFQDEEFTSNWDRLRTVLLEATGKMTLREILNAWPSEWKPPAAASLCRWLDRAAQQGLICQSGAGKKSDSYRYWLPGQEEVWKKSPYYVEELPELEELYGR